MFEHIPYLISYTAVFHNNVKLAHVIICANLSICLQSATGFATPSLTFLCEVRLARFEQAIDGYKRATKRFERGYKPSPALMFVIGRLFGVILSALAVQFIFDGIKDSGLAIAINSTALSAPPLK